MMRCREYIFLLTSDQLQEAGTALALQARLHRLVCRHCRAFTRNDQQLLAALAQQRQNDLLALTPPGKS
jgi:hypothetical protein